MSRKNKAVPDVTGYCVACKKKVDILNPEVVRTKNNKLRIKGVDQNGHKISKFISYNEASGSGLLGSLLGFPGGKVPILSDLPLVGSLI